MIQTWHSCSSGPTKVAVWRTCKFTGSCQWRRSRSEKCGLWRTGPLKRAVVQSFEVPAKPSGQSNALEGSCESLFLCSCLYSSLPSPLSLPSFFVALLAQGVSAQEHISVLRAVDGLVERKLFLMDAVEGKLFLILRLRLALS